MALSTVFHSINSPENAWPSHSVILVLFLPYRTVDYYLKILFSKKRDLLTTDLFMKVSFSPDIILCG